MITVDVASSTSKHLMTAFIQFLGDNGGVDGGGWLVLLGVG